MRRPRSGMEREKERNEGEALLFVIIVIVSPKDAWNGESNMEKKE